MLIIPAIDIKGGKCVRLKQGKMNQATVYYDDPIECAHHWQAMGATRLHIVDLDGAIAGEIRNLPIIKELRRECPKMEIQLGGGIRSMETAQLYLDEIGLNFIVLGTYAMTNPDEVRKIAEHYPDSVYLGLDTATGQVHIAGWMETSEQNVENILQRFAATPLAGVIFTDIMKDGMLSGVDPEFVIQFSRLTLFPLIVAGGVKNIDDIQKMKNIKAVQGVICGRSLYEGSLDFSIALKTALG